MANSSLANSDSSRFLGADPSIGVAVLKRSLTNAKRPKAPESALGSVNEVDQETEFAPVELFYSKGEAQDV